MQWQSAASWHQFLRQLHGTPSRQSNIIRRSPEPKGAHRRGILFRLCQENRVLARYAHIAGTCLIFRNDHEPCFPANFYDFLSAKPVNVRARAESRSVKYRSMQHLHRRNRHFLTHTSSYFPSQALGSASQPLTASSAKAIQHVERHLRIEHRLAKGLKRKQLARLGFQLFDACAASLGCRVEVNYAHSNEPQL